MITFTYQPALRPALPCVYGPLDYREQRTLLQRIDSILSASGLEDEFITLILAEREVDTRSASAARLERFAKYSVLALRTNIARTLTGLDHRDFATRLADSPLLQWFLRALRNGFYQNLLKKHLRPIFPLGQRADGARHQRETHRPACRNPSAK